MKRKLIYADEIESLFLEQVNLGNDPENAFYDALQDAESVDCEPVVRCKDCRRCVKHITKRYKNPMYFCSLLGGQIDCPYQVNPNHYCSHGEKMNKEVEK